MHWDMWDYVAAILLISGAILGIIAARLWLPPGRVQIAAMIAAPVLVAIIWVQLAVGLVG